MYAEDAGLFKDTSHDLGITGETGLAPNSRPGPHGSCLILFFVSETLTCDVQKHSNDAVSLSGSCLILVLAMLFGVLVPVWFVPLVFWVSLFYLCANYCQPVSRPPVLSFVAFLVSIFCSPHICCSSCVFCVLVFSLGNTY